MDHRENPADLSELLEYAAAHEGAAIAGETGGDTVTTAVHRAVVRYRRRRTTTIATGSLCALALAAAGFFLNTTPPQQELPAATTTETDVAWFYNDHNPHSPWTAKPATAFSNGVYDFPSRVDLSTLSCGDPVPAVTGEDYLMSVDSDPENRSDNSSGRPTDPHASATVTTDRDFDLPFDFYVRPAVEAQLRFTPAYILAQNGKVVGAMAGPEGYGNTLKYSQKWGTFYAAGLPPLKASLTSDEFTPLGKTKSCTTSLKTAQGKLRPGTYQLTIVADVTFGKYRLWDKNGKPFSWQPGSPSKPSYQSYIVGEPRTIIVK